jgi:hypothetical protein
MNGPDISSTFERFVPAEVAADFLAITPRRGKS